MTWSRRIWACPFFKTSHKDGIVCTCAKLITMTSTAAMYRYADRYCSAVPGWQDCSMAKQLLQEYEEEHDGQH